MIRRNGKEVVSYFRNSKSVQAIYKGVHIVWQAIRSCFGSGAWFDEKPWYNDEGWKNN